MPCFEFSLEIILNSWILIKIELKWQTESRTSFTIWKYNIYKNVYNCIILFY